MPVYLDYEAVLPAFNDDSRKKQEDGETKLKSHLAQLAESASMEELKEFQRILKICESNFPSGFHPIGRMILENCKTDTKKLIERATKIERYFLSHMRDDLLNLFKPSPRHDRETFMPPRWQEASIEFRLPRRPTTQEGYKDLGDVLLKKLWTVGGASSEQFGFFFKELLICYTTVLMWGYEMSPAGESFLLKCDERLGSDFTTKRKAAFKEAKTAVHEIRAAGERSTCDSAGSSVNTEVSNFSVGDSSQSNSKWMSSLNPVDRRDSLHGTAAKINAAMPPEHVQRLLLDGSTAASGDDSGLNKLLDQLLDIASTFPEVNRSQTMGDPQV